MCVYLNCSISILKIFSLAFLETVAASVHLKAAFYIFAGHLGHCTAMGQGIGGNSYIIYA